MEAYEKLTKMSEEAWILETTSALVNWDQETGMPPGGVEFRAKQSAWIQGRQHELTTSTQVGDWISECESNLENLDPDQQANVREWRYQFDRNAKLPGELVEAFEESRSLAHHAWVEAREASDFKVFQPHLQTILDFMRQKAECWGYEETPYDALLEEFERGATTQQLTSLFDALQPELVEIVGAATSQEPRVSESLLDGIYEERRQKALNAEIAGGLGFDFQSGRIDTAVHPFCTTLGPQDIRLTTRYDERDFTSSLYGVLHEAGHGMYEQGITKMHGGSTSLPTARAVSLGIHESQSRLWENQVGRSAAFWQKWLPAARQQFGNLGAVPLDQMVLAVNQAKKSFIRVEADEVTYDLHIILRFRIEQALITGDLAVADLPGAWNDLVKELFDLKVDQDANGCLQDVHWSFGLFGYFPTYSLGNINAAQLYAKATEDSTISEDLEAGTYESLLSWLRENVHAHGTRLAPSELIATATGAQPDSRFLLEHLRSRYLA